MGRHVDGNERHITERGKKGRRERKGGRKRKGRGRGTSFSNVMEGLSQVGTPFNLDQVRNEGKKEGGKVRRKVEW